MDDSDLDPNCQCPCGANTFTTCEKPILRLICHCTICQEFNQAPFADITIFRSKDVVLPEENSIDFQTYKPPPAVQRGKCEQCDKPAIEFLRLPLLPELTIIPSSNVLSGVSLPEPSLHVFYHRRVTDSSDNLPKYSGYLRSQLGLGSKLVSSLIRGDASN